MKVIITYTEQQTQISDEVKIIEKLQSLFCSEENKKISLM